MIDRVKYFRLGRSLLNFTDCHDLKSLQAVLFMTYFLHSSAKISLCHSYITFAVASSLQMGLHRSMLAGFDPIEIETRKRIFWAIRTMESYVCAILGLPQNISDEDIDQELPFATDDMYISSDRIQSMPAGQISMMSATNAHTKLLEILTKIVRYVYSVRSPGHGRSGRSELYMVSDARVRGIEQDLQDWAENSAWELGFIEEDPPLLR